MSMERFAYKQQITDFIYSHREEMLEVLRQLIEIPSVKGEPATAAPFGREPRRALYKMLEICRQHGFVTGCCDDVMGSADYAPAGNVALGILCHLDVVPVEPTGWSYPPFELTRRDGKLFGRGAIDDKGPCAAALYALYCVKELGIPLNKGVRLLFGTDEENGSGDLEIYRRTHRLPEMVFTPDGSFPVINIEKGMVRADILGEYKTGSVVSFEGGSIPNAVPDKASAVVRGISAQQVESVLSGVSMPAEVTFEQTAGDDISISCKGVPAHASTPQGGVNALTALISVLNRLPLAEGSDAEILRGLEKQFPFGETDGSSAGLKHEDAESGALTLTFSKFSMRDGKISGCVDIRYPVSMKLEQVVQALSAALDRAGVRYGRNIEEQPHIVPSDSEFVQKLLEVYSAVEGEQGHCIAIGGGTYVHDVEGGVAFGVERGDTDYHMHGCDEFITEDELLRDAVLFACAIVDICG